MLLFLVAFAGGALTIASPCILPVLPFLFARADQPFRRNGLPLLIGMAATFALVATLAAVGGGWVVAANQFGRWLALALMTLFATALLWPRLAERLARPLTVLGNRLSLATEGRSSPLASLVLGVATGLLWAPCAGPILGLLLTGAALRGASVGTSLMLLSFAVGAATALALALVAGGRVLQAMKRGLGVGDMLRRLLGAAMLAGVAAIACGLDTGALANLSIAGTGGLEQKLVDLTTGTTDRRAGQAMAAEAAMVTPVAEPTPALDDEGALPALDGAVQWINSAPLTAQALRGKVVLVDFWTYSCVNCLHTLPYVKAWAARYHDQGLVVIGVHAPEFAFERDPGNVAKAVHDLGIDYPVALDNDFALWRRFDNRYWPALYIVDAHGRIRYHHFGEGDYAGSERVIQDLLRQAAGAS
jgi:cytochrome c biogenesis protein CcdA/thiol-disulfide isomerase/thioredoxin